MASVLYVGHATTLIELDGVRLLTDPLLRRHVGHLQRLVPLGEDLPAPDAVLLSHQHADHLDLPSLRRLGQSMLLLVPRGAGWTLRRQGFRRVVELSPGDSTSVGELAIAAVPAVHDGRRYPYGKKVAALGYAVAGSRSVYFAGDTDVFGDMRLIAEMHRPAIGFLPIGDRFTMGPAGAAKAAELLGVRQVVPMHYGTFPFLTGTPAQLRDLLVPRGVEMLELRPGETAS